MPTGNTFPRHNGAFPNSFTCMKEYNFCFGVLLFPSLFQTAFFRQGSPELLSLSALGAPFCISPFRTARLHFDREEIAILPETCDKPPIHGRQRTADMLPLLQISYLRLFFWSMFILNMLPESRETRLRRDSGAAVLFLRGHPTGDPQNRVCSPRGDSHDSRASSGGGIKAASWDMAS